MTVTAPKPPRAPRSLEQATALLDEVARLDGEVATITANRDRAIADTNAVADALLAPIMARREALVGVIKPWWLTDGHILLPTRRKSMELGGCSIGLKTPAASLTFTGDDDAAVAALDGVRWGRPYVRTYRSPDKQALKTALDGHHGDRLRALGFGTSESTPVFVLKAVTQAGTLQAKG